MKRPFFGGNDRGAVMLIAVFFAVFAVSMLYLAIGAGESVLFREHLQDAADSAALSGAITNARIMNVLVLINMVMVVLLAILVTLKLIEGVAIVGIAIAGGLAWCTAGTSLLAVPPLNALRSTVSAIYDDVKPTVFMALETLHDVGDQIAQAGPKITETVTEGALDGWGGAVVAKGFAALTASELPVAEDSFEGLCGKAGALSGEIANFPLSVIPGWGAISGPLSGAIGSLTRSLSEWFCGDGQNSVPDLSQDVPMGYPQTNKSLACQQSTASGYEEGHEEQATSPECQAADEERIAGAPDASGNCQQQCKPGEAYDLATTNARETCNPSSSPAPTKYRYQVQAGTVEYKWNGVGWVRGEPLWQSSDLVGPTDTLPCTTSYAEHNPFPVFDVDGNPCGQLTSKGYFPGYNATVHPPDDPTRVLPACTNECAPQKPPAKTESDPTRKVAFVEVTQVLSCVRTEHQPVDVSLTKESPNSEAKQEGNSKAPKRVKEGVTLGSEDFQVRAIVLGNQQQRESQRLVRLGQWGKPDPTNPIGRLSSLGNFTIAQAEYFYDGKEGQDAWMWNMNWRGRLRRFELPSDNDHKSTLRDICSQYDLGNDCSRILDSVADWNELISH